MSQEQILQVSTSLSDVRPNSEYESENTKEKAVVNCKIVASHCFALLTIVMFKFAHGFDGGFTSIILPLLYKPEAEISITKDELTWFSSYCFLPPFGAIIGGVVTQYIGCRKLLFVCGALFTASGLMFHWSTNAAMLLSAQAIVGLVGGLLKGPSYTYLAEVSLPKLRSIFMGSIAVSLTAGLFVATTLGTYLHWKTIVLINISFPIMGMIFITFLPESPYWLASKNRYQEAAESLAWYRGWTTPDNVQSEMRTALSKSDNASSLAATTSTTGRFNRLKEISMKFVERTFYIPFLTILFIFAVNNFNGTSILPIFSIVVYEKIDSPADPHTVAIVASGLRIVAGTIGTLLINVSGKRILLLTTLLCSGILLTAVAVFVYLTSTNKLAGAAYHWIPVVSIVIADFFNCLGIHKISLIINSEIFPRHLRHIGVGVGHFINTISQSAVNKVFVYMMEGLTVSGAFLCFSIVNIVGFVGIYFILPETEDKTLKAIEDHYVDRKNTIN